MFSKCTVWFIACLVVLSGLAAAAQVTVTVSSPLNNSTITSPMHVAAKATSSYAITGWRVYVDGVSQYLTNNVSSINTYINMTTGTHQVVVRAWASNGSYGSVYLTETVGSAPAPAPSPTPSPIQMTTTSVPSGTVGTAYKATLTASGGTAPYTWSVISGALPPGLALASTGVISGTPTTGGSYTFSLQVKDSAASPQAATNSFTIRVGSILWKGSVETGDLTQWYQNQDGRGVGLTGASSAVATTERAHSGTWSAKLTINTPNSPTSGARLFRWHEAQNSAYFNSGLYYSAWLYFPTTYHVDKYFYNIFQFKSQYVNSSGQTVTDPIWYVSLKNRTDGSMYATLVWWNQLKIQGPHQGEWNSSTGWPVRTYEQTIANIPIGKWVHFEAYLKQAPQNNFTGRLTIWQDGVQIFDEQNVVTEYTTGSQWWGINNYSDQLTPNPAVIYVDDAVVSTQRMWPN